MEIKISRIHKKVITIIRIQEDVEEEEGKMVEEEEEITEEIRIQINITTLIRIQKIVEINTIRVTTKILTDKVTEERETIKIITKTKTKTVVEVAAAEVEVEGEEEDRRIKDIMTTEVSIITLTKDNNKTKTNNKSSTACVVGQNNILVNSVICIS